MAERGSIPPKAFDPIPVQNVVAAEEGDVLGEALRDDETVERAAVMEWEPRNHVEARGGDPHYPDAMLDGFLNREFHEREFELEFARA